MRGTFVGYLYNHVFMIQCEDDCLFKGHQQLTSLVNTENRPSILNKIKKKSKGCRLYNRKNAIGATV